MIRLSPDNAAALRGFLTSALSHAKVTGVWDRELPSFQEEIESFNKKMDEVGSE